MQQPSPKTDSLRLEELARKSPEDARLVAADPAAPGTLLERLTRSKDPQILSQLAQNPNTPKQILFQLAKRFPVQVLQNPAIPLLLLENPDALRTEIDADAARAFLSLPDCPEDFFYLVASHKDGAVRTEAASHAKTPASVLLTLQNDTSWMVTYALAHNPNTPREIIAKLLEHATEAIRRLAVKHRNVPKERLEFLQRAGVSKLTSHEI